MDRDVTVVLCLQLSLLPFAPLGIAVGFRRTGLFLCWGGFFGMVRINSWPSNDAGPAEGVTTRKRVNKST